MESAPDTPKPTAVPERATLPSRLDDSRQVLAGWAMHPPAADVHIARYAEAMLPRHDTPGPIYDTACDLLAQRPEMGSSHLETLKLRAMQKQLIALHGDAYPTVLRTVGDWDTGIQAVLANPHRLAEWNYDMHNRDLQTNDPNRGDNLKVFLSIAHQLGRLATGNIIEIGASQGLIQKRLAQQALQGFSVPLHHFGRTESGIPLPHVVEPGSGISSSYTYAYQRLLNQEVPVGKLVSMDRADPLASREWTLLSLYPGEHEDKQRLKYMRSLAYTDFDSVEFYQADFDELEPDAYRQAHPQAETIFVPTCFYQSPPEARNRMTAKAIAMASEFVVIQDNCMVDALDPTKLNFPSDWQSVPYGYKTYVWDKRAAKPKWEELFMSPNSRANRVRIGSASIVDCYGTSVSAWDVVDGAL